MNCFGDRITELRSEFDLTQEELAEKLSLTRAALSHYENNRREPDFDTVKIFAKYFKVSVDYLVGHTNIRNGHIIPEDLLKKHLSGFMKNHQLEVFVKGEYTEEELIPKLIAHLESKGYKVTPQNGP